MSTVAGTSTALSGSLGRQVSLAVAAKTLDAAKAQGDAVLSLLQAAAELQQTVNAADAPAPGPVTRIGAHIDVTA